MLVIHCLFAARIRWRIFFWAGSAAKLFTSHGSFCVSYNSSTGLVFQKSASGARYNSDVRVCDAKHIKTPKVFFTVTRG